MLLVSIKTVERILNLSVIGNIMISKPFLSVNVHTHRALIWNFFPSFAHFKGVTQFSSWLTNAKIFLYVGYYIKLFNYYTLQHLNLYLSY